MIGSPPPLEILEHLSYDERTGIFTRIKSSVQNSRYIGKQAGTLHAIRNWLASLILSAERLLKRGKNK